MTSYKYNENITSKINNNKDVLKLGPMNNQKIYVEEDINNIERYLLLVDSSNRNWDVESSNKYTIDLIETYKYVTSVELINGSIPINIYNITNSNNRLDYEINDEKYILYICPGKYEIKLLLKTINKQIHDQSNKHIIFKLNKITKKIYIESITQFNLYFTDSKEIIGSSYFTEVMQINPTTNKREYIKKNIVTEKNKYIENSIGKSLGFKPINLFNNIKYHADFIYNLRPYNYVSLFINDSGSNRFDLVKSSNPNCDGAFAILYINQEDKIIFTNEITDNIEYIKYFNPPINFNKLKIEFRTPNGELVDFNGDENYLLFRLTQLYNNNIITSTNQMK